MDGLLWDLRHALRGLRRTPGFTLVAVLTLALGIGANTAIFSLLDEVLLRPLAVRAPEELAQVVSAEGGFGVGDFAYPEFVDLANAGGESRPVAATAVLGTVLGANGVTARAYGEQVSGNYFSMLGVPPALGRTLLPSDDREGVAPVVVLGHDLWRSRFGSDPGILGRQIQLDRTSVTVVGIAGAGFRGTLRGFPAAFWVPLQVGAQLTPGPSMARTSRMMRWLTLFARAPRSTWHASEADLNRALVAGGGDEARRRLVLRPAGRGDTSLLEGPGRLSRLLMALVLVLLSIAAANVAGLLLARTEGRRREIAIRLALGSDLRRLSRLLLIENGLLALAGGALGVLAALWTTGFLETFTPPSPMPLDLSYRLDGRVLAFSGALVLLTGIAFALTPMLQARRVNLLDALKRDASAGWWSRRRVDPRRLLVASQVALSVVLLTAAGLFLRTLWNERSVPLGFDPKDRVAVRIALGATGFDGERADAFYVELLERVRSMPGVKSAALAEALPPSPVGNMGRFTGEELGVPGAPETILGMETVGSDYFRTLGIALIAGRDFTSEELGSHARVAIVNRALAERLWRGANPVGRTLALRGASEPAWQVVGVADNVLNEGLREQTRPYLYLSAPMWGNPGKTLVIHCEPGARNLFAAVTTIVAELDSRIALFNPITIERHLAQSMVEARFGAVLMGAFGLLALGLTALGLYGLLAFAVTRRTREIGLRLALGATPARVLRMIVSESFTIAIPGFIAGLALAIGLSRLVASLLFGVAPIDPLTYAVMAALMASALLIAAWLPGRRAARLEPTVALREE